MVKNRHDNLIKEYRLKIYNTTMLYNENKLEKVNYCGDNILSNDYLFETAIDNISRILLKGIKRTKQREKDGENKKQDNSKKINKNDIETDKNEEELNKKILNKKNIFSETDGIKQQECLTVGQQPPVNKRYKKPTNRLDCLQSLMYNMPQVIN